LAMEQWFHLVNFAELLRQEQDQLLEISCQKSEIINFK
jgi:hypothetical protein